ncbi:MAG: electron transfer flavoprotein subunit alpha [Lachnospiraceae bacterium]|nr:electron transfer flavoprotein subunit alpha [Lachnospiraceae bacterium]
MGLVIHSEKIDPEAAKQLISVCPFGAISYDGSLKISSACKLCKLCVRKGPAGAVTFEEEEKPVCDKTAWKGIAVFAEQRNGKIHPVSLELVGKAKELARVTGHPVLSVLIGSGVEEAARELLEVGVDRVYVYDDPAFREFVITPYANAFTDFIEKVRPSSILVGATVLGRSLAPKVAARVHAGLTADCTMLEMKENTDLVQIRPAFGGNIMAQIVTPNTRPQFCTVRYKIFSAPEKEVPHGEIVPLSLPEDKLRGKTEVLKTVKKPTEIDISEADVILAVGRGVKSRDDLEWIRGLADQLGARLACTRPMVEAGWFDARHQIGLSGRTVKPKLIITAGVSGSVQFAAGMRGSDLIIAINSDPNASIFDIAHYGFVGDLYEILPRLVKDLKEGRHVS